MAKFTVQNGNAEALLYPAKPEPIEVVIHRESPGIPVEGVLHEIKDYLHKKYGATYFDPRSGEHINSPILMRDASFYADVACIQVGNEQCVIKAIGGTFARWGLITDGPNDPTNPSATLAVDQKHLLMGLPQLPEYRGSFFDQEGRLLGILMKYIPGQNLVEAFQTGTITLKEAEVKVYETLRGIHASSGLFLCDRHTPDNFKLPDSDTMILVDAGAIGVPEKDTPPATGDLTPFHKKITDEVIECLLKA